MENVLHWGAKHRKIFFENMLLHARTNIGITFLAYFPKHNQTAENNLHGAKHNLKENDLCWFGHGPHGSQENM